MIIFISKYDQERFLDTFANIFHDASDEILSIQQVHIISDILHQPHVFSEYGMAAVAATVSSI
jgi:hypothetical protein